MARKEGGVMVGGAGVVEAPACYLQVGVKITNQHRLCPTGKRWRFAKPAGMIDGRTLGKIEVFVMNAAAFLNAFYTRAEFASQKVGNSRIAMRSMKQAG